MLRFRNRFRVLMALLAVAGALTLVATEADARAGGGFSGGSRGARTFSAPSITRTAPTAAQPMQRTVTQPGSFGNPAAAPASGGLFGRPGGGLFGGGMLGGLAAGFLGAGLFGMLFGHGLFGGLGGISSLFGLLLQIGLVVIVARLAWAWWQRRQQQPAFAGPAMRNGLNGGGLGGMGLGGGAGAAPASGPSDQLGIKPADFDAFEKLLGEVQTAYAAEDLGALRVRVTPEMLSYFAEDLAQNASRGVHNQVSDVQLLQGDLAEAWREGSTDYATVAMRFSLVDKTVDRASGQLVEGSTSPREVTELWTFRRGPGGAWLLSAIQQA
jgi:predicted lipid-binding transport protein (Tim44 family)